MGFVLEGKQSEMVRRRTKNGYQNSERNSDSHADCKGGESGRDSSSCRERDTKKNDCVDECAVRAARRNNFNATNRGVANTELKYKANSDAIRRHGGKTAFAEAANGTANVCENEKSENSPESPSRVGYLLASTKTERVRLDDDLKACSYHTEREQKLDEAANDDDRTCTCL